jgi:hypothetical protein
VYREAMELRNLKKLLGAGWALTVLAIGATVGLSSVAGTALLVGFALIPPSLMLALWKDPTQTMSESIQRARR